MVVNVETLPTKKAPPASKREDIPKSVKKPNTPIKKRKKDSESEEEDEVVRKGKPTKSERLGGKLSWFHCLCRDSIKLVIIFARQNMNNLEFTGVFEMKL